MGTWTSETLFVCLVYFFKFIANLFFFIFFICYVLLHCTAFVICHVILYPSISVSHRSNNAAFHICLIMPLRLSAYRPLSTPSLAELYSCTSFLSTTLTRPYMQFNSGEPYGSINCYASSACIDAAYCCRCVAWCVCMCASVCLLVRPWAVQTTEPTANESVPIQLAQCWFPALAISSAKIYIYFSNKICGSNCIKQCRKLLWFEITKMLIAAWKINLLCYLWYFRHTFVPYWGAVWGVDS